MHTLQKRRERWEFENQQQLEKSLQLSQHLLRKQLGLVAGLLSFLFYLLYKVLYKVVYRGTRALLRGHQALWSAHRDIDQRLADAEQQRLKLSCHCSQWLK